MTQKTKPRINSGKKGAKFELDIAKEAFLECGIKLERNPYRQQKQANEPDLVSEDASWPFAIECKRYRETTNIKGWMAQAEAAAAAYEKEPVVIYKLDRKSPRAVIKASTLIKLVGGTWEWGAYIELDLEDFWLLAREAWGMAVAAIPPTCPECFGSGVCEKITYRNYGRGPEPDSEDVECTYCGGVGTL